MEKSSTLIINNKEYYLQKQIGSGAFGKVYKANTKDKQEVAIKVIENIEEHLLHENENEVAILKKIQNDDKIDPTDLDYFVRIIDDSKEVVNIDDNGCKRLKMMIVVEYCNLGDMQTYLEKNKELDEKKAINLISQIIYALRILKNLNIVHRDLKPSNILVRSQDENVFIKITDFGCSKVIEMDKSKTEEITNNDKSNLINSLVGTPLYMSPQILNGEKYTNKADIWSLGILYYQMLFAKTPWNAKSLDDYRRILNMNAKINFPININPITRESQNFIKNCLQIDESKRIEWDNLFIDPLINENIKLLESKKMNSKKVGQNQNQCADKPDDQNNQTKDMKIELKNDINKNNNDEYKNPGKNSENQSNLSIPKRSLEKEENHITKSPINSEKDDSLNANECFDFEYIDTKFLFFNHVILSIEIYTSHYNKKPFKIGDIENLTALKSELIKNINQEVQKSIDYYQKLDKSGHEIKEEIKHFECLESKTKNYLKELNINNNNIISLEDLKKRPKSLKDNFLVAVKQAQEKKIFNHDKEYLISCLALIFWLGQLEENIDKKDNRIFQEILEKGDNFKRMELNKQEEIILNNK